jgi:hypothetical protein
MFAKGIGVRQFATRIALYCEAKDARSADEVPGIPLASDAPGAPAVEPPIADGQVGVGVGAGVGAAVTGAGVVVNVRPATVALAVVAETEVAGAGTGAGAAVVAAEAVVAVVSLAVVVAAGVVLPPRSWDNASEEPLGAAELATMSTLAREGVTLTAGAAPWIRITVATAAVARNTAFFNVCTPIQRLHCPPI